MSIFESSVIFLCITAFLAYLNKRFIKLPTAIGVMAISIILSLFVLALDKMGFSTLANFEKSLLDSLDFSEVLLNIMLSMLLFAGALHVNISDLKQYRWPVGFLAVVGTLVSALLVAGLTYFIMPLLGIELPFIWCLIFGTLISPTDPIAVMGILRSAGAPKSVETVISGESLFNDGIGVVVFVLLLGILNSGTLPSFGEGAMLFGKEAFGGMLFGFVIGAIAFYMIKSIDSYVEEVLITLATVLGGYALAHHWHLSGPLAMVVTGLMLGNHGRNHAMSDVTREYVDLFWELIDEILNAILFMLIGIEIMLIAFNSTIFVAGLIAIAIALFARVTVVGKATMMLRQRLNLPKGAWKVLTWGGLRGGISIALVLSLPEGEERNVLLALTYAIVVFSILIQGLTVGKVAKSIQP